VSAFRFFKEKTLMLSNRKVSFLLLLVFLLAGCAAGRSAFNKGEKLEQEGKLDEAILKYAEASKAAPDVAEYRVRFLKAGEASARAHLRQGDEFLEKENYNDALREYETAVAMDASLERARQQGELVVKLRNALVYYQEGAEFEKNNKSREALRSYQKALTLNAELKAAKEGVDRLTAGRKPKLDGHELNLKSTKPITLKFKDARLKEVFNILSQLSGISFIFDEGIKDQNVTIYLENATFQQALEVLCGINKLGKKVLNESSIILYQKNPDKIKQYEELLVETFYLNKLDAKKAVNLIRTMLQVRKIYVNEEMNALVIRDTPDVIEVTRKILEANDIPDAEVVLDVEVVEISKTNTEAFGLALSKYSISGNVLTPGNAFFSDTLPATVTTTSGASQTPNSVGVANLLNLFAWKGFNGFITVPNATFNFGKTLANGETLANPKIRVKNREKAKFNVGQRVPVTTTSSPVGGGISVNVQYVDVGVKVNAEPTIQLNNDVSIKLSMEVSSILSSNTVGGESSATTVVTIGTRNLDTVLNLRDGETSIIGGLIQDTSNKSKNKVMLLGDIPLLGPLFSSNNNTDTKNELVLAITPRIVRGITIPEADVSSFWSGKEDEPSVTRPYSSYTEEPETGLEQPAMPGTAGGQPAPSLPHVQSPSSPAQPAKPVLPATSTPPAPSPVPAVVPQPAAKTAAPPAPAVPAPPAEVAGKTTLRLVTPPSVKKGDQFTVEVRAADVKNLYTAPFTLTFDPIFAEFVSAVEGDLLKIDGKPTSFLSSPDKNTGRVVVGTGRTGNVGGVSGTGSLLTATFKAKSKGPASFGLTGVNFIAPTGQKLDVVPYNAVVDIK
jgi:general secretion pathway protein D